MAKETEHFCRCCLLSENESQNPLADMKSETFVHGNKKITFSDGYADVNNFTESDFHIPDERICEICVVQLENAYLFRNLCRITTAILNRKYSTLGNNSKARVEIKSKAECDSSDQKQCGDTENEDLNKRTTKNQQSASRVRTHKKHICKKCRKSFGRSGNLKRHNRDVWCNPQSEPIQKTKYECNLCPAFYSCKSNLIRHQKTKHSSANNSDQKMLLQHNQYQSSIPSASDEKMLLQHNQYQGSIPSASDEKMLLQHNQYQCSFCQKMFARKCSLLHHINTQHVKNERIVPHKQ